MNYQKIKLKPLGPEITVDLDSHKAKCKKCNQPIKFGISDIGKYIPIQELGDGFAQHFCGVYAAQLKVKNPNMPSREEQENRNQEFLNSL